MKLKLVFIFIVLALPLLAIARDEEDIDEYESHEIVDIEEDEPIDVCTDDSEDSICKCEKETLTCEHQFINGENLNTADIIVRKHGFIVKNVIIRDNSIKILRKELILPGRESEIVKLDFFHNFISKIENNAFDLFDSLEELNLGSNLLKTVDTKIFTNQLGSTLKSLRLHHNQFEELTGRSFYYLTELEKLDLSFNPHLEVNSFILSKSLSNLKTLNLNYCDIRLLDDDAFANLKSLSSLELKGNPFTTIPKAITSLPQLTKLDFSNTNVTQIPEKAFDGNKNLTHLFIRSSNLLLSLEDCAFCGLPKLEELDLSYSEKLHWIHENALGRVSAENVSTIKYFGLRECNITTLPENLVRLTSFKHMELVSNPFECNCSMAWLINNPKIYGHQTVPTCATPPSLNRTRFTTLAGSFCNNGALSNPKAKNILWLLVIIIFVALIFVMYQRRHRIINSIYKIRQTQSGYRDVNPVNL